MISHEIKKNNQQHLESQRIVDEFLASGKKVTYFPHNAISTNRYHPPSKSKRHVTHHGSRRSKKFEV